MSVIRKLSIGKGFPDGAIHFVLNQTKRLAGKEYKIVDITEVKEPDTGDRKFEVFICDGTSTLLWKTVKDQSVVVEYLVEFD